MSLCAKIYLFKLCSSFSFHLYNFLYLYNVFIQAHIQTFRGRILETILSLRFLIFQYGIVYKLKLTAHNTSLAVSEELSLSTS